MRERKSCLAATGMGPAAVCSKMRLGALVLLSNEKEGHHFTRMSAGPLPGTQHGQAGAGTSKGVGLQQLIVNQTSMVLEARETAAIPPGGRGHRYGAGAD